MKFLVTFSYIRRHIPVGKRTAVVKNLPDGRGFRQFVQFSLVPSDQTYPSGVLSRPIMNTLITKMSESYSS